MHNRRATDPTSNKNLVSTYVLAIILLGICTMASIVVITILRPEQDNTSIIATIVGFATPLMLGILSLMSRENHLSMNSRLDQLIDNTRTVARMEGAIQGAAIPVDPKAAEKLLEVAINPVEAEKKNAS